jgi:nucleoside-diphosphate kinase
MQLEQTLVLIKPDALKNSSTGYILSLFAELHTGLRFAGLKVAHVHRMLAEEHYAEHKGKIFYPELIDYIMGKLHHQSNPACRRVIAIVYEGYDAVKKVRDLAGPTDPNTAREQNPGTIRTLGAVIPVIPTDGRPPFHRMDNLIHASATLQEAEREIKLWFKTNDMVPGMRHFPTAEANEHYYFLDDHVYTCHKPNSTCLLAPGDVAWKSDLEILEAGVGQENPPVHPLRYVAAKYILNDRIAE